MAGRFVDSEEAKNKQYGNSSSISAVSDCGTTSTDRDLSVGRHFNVNKTAEVINSTQVSYETVLLPGRNTDSEESKISSSDISHDVTGKVMHALPESDSKSNDDISDSEMQEGTTITPSVKTVVTDESTLILDGVNQSTFPDNIPNVDPYDQDNSQSGSQFTSPVEAEDSGSQDVPITTLNNPQSVVDGLAGVDEVGARLVTGNPTFPTVAGVAQSDIVVSKPVEDAEVVWVHPQSCLASKSVYEIGQYSKLPRFGDCIGKGGNGEVYKCFVNVPGNDEDLCLACKIEKKKPLYRNPALFEEICNLNNESHFIIIHAYLKVKCQQSILHPYGYVGYLLMEYFPLGSITDNLKKFQPGNKHGNLKTLAQLSQEIEELESDMREKENGTDDEFGKFRHQWCSLQRQKEKVVAWCRHIIRGVMQTIKRLHEKKLMHLDIKDHNFLLRKTCEHKELFMCECNTPSFDVLIGDFDYTQELGGYILQPKSVGTRGYKAPQLESLGSKQPARPCLDLYSNMVTIIRVACKISWGGNDSCMKILKLWEALLLYSSDFEAKLNMLYEKLEMIMNYIRKLDNVNHFDNERHCCIKDCEFFKNEIAFCLRELVMPPQDRYLYEITNQMMQFGSEALITGYSGVFLTHGLTSLIEDGVLLYMKDILSGTIADWQLFMKIT